MILQRIWWWNCWIVRPGTIGLPLLPEEGWWGSYFPLSSSSFGVGVYQGKVQKHPVWSKIIDLLIWLKIAIWHQSWYIIQTYMCFGVIVFGTSSSAALDGEGLAYKITDCQLRGFDLCRLCSRPSTPTPQYQHRNHNWNISSALHWDLLNQCLPAQNIQTSRDFNFEFAFSLGLVKTKSALSTRPSKIDE